MGMVQVKLTGSFNTLNTVEEFTASKHGHAATVANAITFLSKEILPSAIALDHELALRGIKPAANFGKD